jgi:hypothetical protein
VKFEEQNHHLEVENPFFTLSFLPFFTKDAPYPCIGGILLPFLVIGGDLEMPYLPLWGIILAVREVSTNMGWLVREGSGLFWLFSLRYGSNTFHPMLGEVHNHEDKSNPNPIHQILNHTLHLDLLVGPLESYITRAIHGEKRGGHIEHQTSDLGRKLGGNAKRKKPLFLR